MILSAFGCKNKTDDLEEEEPLSTPTIITNVDTYVLRPKVFNFTNPSNGKIVPEIEQKIFSPISGKILYIDIRNNSVVNKNQLLIKFDTEDLRLKQLKSNDRIYNAKMDYRSALLGVEGLIKNASQEVRDSVSKKLKSTSGLTNALLEAEELANELRRSSIQAPFSGIVANLKVSKDNYVKAGEEIMTVYSAKSLFVEISVLESDLGHIKLGQTASVNSLSSTKEYSAKVYDINPIVDQNGLTLVKLKLLDSSELFPGMNCLAKISIPTKKILAIPKSAVLVRGGKTLAFILEGKFAKWKYVTLGQENGTDVEVISGLKPGDKVIISNNTQLAEDVEVKEQTK